MDASPEALREWRAPDRVSHMHPRALWQKAARLDVAHPPWVRLSPRIVVDGKYMIELIVKLG